MIAFPPQRVRFQAEPHSTSVRSVASVVSFSSTLVCRAEVFDEGGLITIHLNAHSPRNTDDFH